ncbi:MAG TPA: hypothetical protein VKC65_06455 [Gaiellaceae bacterium]|nr:hypothetical protein [Gaiellaceae bacterium]HKB20640.1 hypothetical protein [Gaiellaceae bacterium]
MKRVLVLDVAATGLAVPATFEIECNHGQGPSEPSSLTSDSAQLKLA